jgi:hypothetical protein
MKKLLTFLPVLLLSAISSYAQIFWVENFESGSSSGLEVQAYTGPNGTWTLTTGISTAEGGAPNPWYVSCAEAGHIAGVCGSVCSGTSADLGATLHIGSDPTMSLGDIGASYDAGGLCPTFYCVTTDRRAESPIINCTGKTNINLRFYYIENGQGAIDDGWVEYYDGTTWSLLVNTAKTTVCASTQGQWAVQNITLPVSANNNPNVKIGFRWINNDDGVGTDPSYAIDSVTLSTTAATPTASFTTTATTACFDSCITFTSTTSGTPDSVRWTVSPTGPTISSATSTTTTNICFSPAGIYSVTLTAYGGGSSTSSTTVVTVNPAPHPTITKTGHVLSVPAAYTSYQWYNGSSAITGATNSTYTYTVTGVYSVQVDSAGCIGNSTVVNTTGIANINGIAENYWVSQPNASTVVLNAAQPTDDALNVAIYDATGRKIIDETWNAGSLSKQITGLSFSPGLYIIKVSNINTSAIFKLLKQ